MTRKRKTCERVVVSVPVAQELLGYGKRQCDLRVGGTYELAPHCDLWMRGAKTARVKRFYLNEHGEPISASVVPVRNGYDVTGTHYVVIDHFA